MNKSVYIKRKINELEKCEKYFSQSQIKNLGRFIMVTIPTVALAIALGKYFMLYKAASMVGVFSAMLMAGARFDFCSKRNSINQIREEKKHLNSIKTKGINSTRTLDQKRIERISSLQDKQEEMNEKGIKTGILAGIAGVTTGLGAIGILFNPLVGGIVSGISFLTATRLASEDLEGEKNYNKLEARINNLKNDIELGSIYGYETTKTQSDKSNKPISEPSKKTDKKQKFSKQQEKQIEEYLSFLSAMKDKEQAKVNQKKRK